MTIGIKRKLEDEPGLAAKAAKKTPEQILNELPSCFSKSEYPIEFSPPREEDNTVLPPGLNEEDSGLGQDSNESIDMSAALDESAVDTDSLTSEGTAVVVEASNTSAIIFSTTTTQVQASSKVVEVDTCNIAMGVEATAAVHSVVDPLRGDLEVEESLTATTTYNYNTPSYNNINSYSGESAEEEGLQQVPVKRPIESEESQQLKRQCIQELPRDSRPPSSLEEPLIMPPESTDDNKENLVCLKTLTENQNFESILQKTLLATRTSSADGSHSSASKEASTAAKVIVEHLPNSSVYDMDHNSLDHDNSVLDDDEDSDDESSMFDTPPPTKSTAYDRFWTTTASGMSSTTTTPPLASTYQFLEQNNQRIECDENGKSYLQLGTVNHHHLPVTPVLQPKPTTLSPRRPQSLCRPHTLPPRPPNPTPPVICEHMSHSSPARSCSTSCYRQQRSDMLSLSLHKLHSARQRSDSSLRRSVLICNMLRYIELESTTEQRHHAESIGYAQEPMSLDQSPYWNSSPVPNFSPPPTPNPYRDNGNGYSTNVDNSSNNSSCENFDAPLKDFHSAFRQSSNNPPLVPQSITQSSSSSCSGAVNTVTMTHHDVTSSVSLTSPMSSQSSTVTSSLDDERGINWSSVLSLSSQTELDPLNNNTYSDSSSMSSWGSHPPVLSELDLSQTSFEDVSWKVSANGLPTTAADELMKTFPEENLFECAA